MAKCHFFFVLDSVMKTRANITPPFEVNSTESIPAEFQEYDLVADTDEQERLFELQAHNVGSDVPDEVPVKKFKPEKRVFAHKFQKGSASAIADAMKLQAEISGEHFKRLDECKRIEMQNNSIKIEIEKSRLLMDETREERMLKIEERKIEQNFQLEKMRIEREESKERNDIEKLKLQIELEKLKKLN